MDVRRLSPDSLWIEIPPSVQTCLVVWHAMATCGLRKGKINSYREEHFGPLYDWQKKTVEGCTKQGLFDPQAKIQAQFMPHEGGTLIKFLAGNINQGFDFGSSWREKRRLVPQIEEVLRQTPLDWQEDLLNQHPPIASPHNFNTSPIHGTPSFEVIVPLVDLKTSLNEQGISALGCLPWAVAFTVAGYLHATGPLFLALAIWEAWKWRQNPYSRNFASVLYILFCLFWGVPQSWRLLQHWM